MNVSYQIIRSKRKTISLQICPDCTVKIKIPNSLSSKKIDEIIKLKQNWINKKIEYFKNRPFFVKKEKQYQDGEIFHYLGRKFLLKVFESKDFAIERVDSTIFLYKKNTQNTKNIIKKWFTSLAQEVFNERLIINFENFSKKYKYPLPSLKIRQMKSRWGSMSSNGQMTLNVNLIHHDIRYIDYVIMHELCHLKHHNHSKKFYLLQEEFTPNWKALKKELNTNINLN